MKLYDVEVTEHVTYRIRLLARNEDHAEERAESKMLEGDVPDAEAVVRDYSVERVDA